MLRQMECSAIYLLAKRGKSQRQIARELGYSRATVARVLHEPIEKAPARRTRSSLVDPYRPQIEQWVRRGPDGRPDAGISSGRSGPALPWWSVGVQ